jgi:hypothetical protein
VQGGDVGQIEDADTAIAWTLAQLPFTAQDRTQVVALSWPKNVEPQDLYPAATSTYTLPTGTTVEVPCFALNKVVKVEQAECPDSFVNPLDADDGRPCVKVLHFPALYIHYVYSHSFVTNCTPSLAQWQHTQTTSTH